jgi:hypothetical protein
MNRKRRPVGVVGAGVAGATVVRALALAECVGLPVERYRCTVHRWGTLKRLLQPINRRAGASPPDPLSLMFPTTP